MSIEVPLPPVQSADEVVDRFLAGTLDTGSWTHAAHLMVCRRVLETSLDTPDAIARLRTLIQRHNERAGIRPGHGGYHETVTRYFVQATAAAAPPTVAALLVEPTLRREAPLRHWSRGLLESDEARSGWVEPDLQPLPWT